MTLLFTAALQGHPITCKQQLKDSSHQWLMVKEQGTVVLGLQSQHYGPNSHLTFLSLYLHLTMLHFSHHRENILCLTAGTYHISVSVPSKGNVCDWVLQ